MSVSSSASRLWRIYAKRHNRQYFYHKVYYKLTWWFRKRWPRFKFRRPVFFIRNHDFTAVFWSKERYSEARPWETWRHGYKPLWVYGWWWKKRIMKSNAKTKK